MFCVPNPSPRRARPLLPALVVTAVAALTFSPLPTRAQNGDAKPSPAASVEASDDDLSESDYADMGEAGPIVRDLRKTKNKTVVLIFDVSGSMRADKMIRRARQAAINIIRRGTYPGDDVELLTFGAGYNDVHKKITRGSDRSEIADEVPKETAEGSGTNIRKPHHEALKNLDKTPGRPAVIILLTDSFNDEPKQTDATYPDYRKYYTPGGMLTKYPKTSENQDYERLLAKLVQSGKVKQYGIGINIAENGRPIERLPQAAPPPVEVKDTPPTVVGAVNSSESGGLPLIPIGIGLAVLIVGGIFLAPLFKTSALRISGGPGGKKDFPLKSGSQIRIGGDGANFSPDAYGIPGVTRIVAQVRVRGGRMSIAPGAATPAAAGAKSAAGAPPTTASTGNQTDGIRVFHNGLPLESEASLGFGDEVRISVPPPGGVGVAKEYRLKFEDPKKSF